MARTFASSVVAVLLLGAVGADEAGGFLSSTPSAASNSTSEPLRSEECTQLSGTYCDGQDQACDCNYCDDFSGNSFCANTCRVMNGFFSSPYRWNPWAAVYVTNPKNADDGTSCAWMEGSGYGGKGDDCKQCDENAMKCRRANPPSLGATYSQNSGGNCRAPGGGSGECTQLSGTYCDGQDQACDCNYCDDFSGNSFCANTCRVMNGFFSSPYRSNPWAAVYVKNPTDADDGTSCAWMEGSGYGGKGDDCKQCDENAMKCRRANPPSLGATYSQNSGGNCRAPR